MLNGKWSPQMKEPSASIDTIAAIATSTLHAIKVPLRASFEGAHLSMLEA